MPGGRGLSGSGCPHEMRQGGARTCGAVWAEQRMSAPHDTVVGGAKARGRARAGGGDWSWQRARRDAAGRTYSARTYAA
jgi:hypothetical protein